MGEINERGTHKIGGLSSCKPTGWEIIQVNPTVCRMTKLVCLQKMASHSKIHRAWFFNLTKGTHPEMTFIHNMSLMNRKWPVHVASSNFFVNESHHVVWLNFGRREVVGNESEINRRKIAYR